MVAQILGSGRGSVAPHRRGCAWRRPRHLGGGRGCDSCLALRPGKPPACRPKDCWADGSSPPELEAAWVRGWVQTI